MNIVGAVNSRPQYQAMMFNILLSICCLTTTVRFIEAFNLPPKQQLQRTNHNSVTQLSPTQLSSSSIEEQATTTSFDDIESYKDTNPSAGADGYSILRRPVTVSYFLCVYHMITIYLTNIC